MGNQTDANRGIHETYKKLKGQTMFGIIDNNVSELCFYHPTTAEIRFKFEGITIAFKSSVHEMFSVDNLYTEQAVHPDDRYKTKKNAGRKFTTHYGDSKQWVIMAALLLLDAYKRAETMNF